MNSFGFIVSLLVLSFSLSFDRPAASAATVSGTVRLFEKTLTGLQPAPEMEYVFVYLLPDDAPTRALLDDEAAYPRVTVYMNQKDKEFDPRIVMIRKGAKVRFGNADPWFHNVYSKEPDFTLGRYPRGYFKEQVFDKVGASHIFCDIHLNMHAMVVVVDTPLYTRAAKDGLFRLENVPPGRYKLTAWQERSGTVSQDLSVGASDASGLSITLEEKERKSIDRGTETNPYANARSLLK